MAKKIKRTITGAKPTISEAQEELALHVALDKFKKEEAGEIIVNTFTEDISQAIARIRTEYKTLTLDEFTRLAIFLDERMTFIRLLTKAQSDAELIISFIKEETGQTE